MNYFLSLFVVSDDTAVDGHSVPRPFLPCRISSRCLRRSFAAAVVELPEIGHHVLHRRPRFAEKGDVFFTGENVIAIDDQNEFRIEILPVIGVLPAGFIHGNEWVTFRNSQSCGTAPFFFRLWRTGSPVCCVFQTHRPGSGYPRGTLRPNKARIGTNPEVLEPSFQVSSGRPAESKEQGVI